jgi:DNA polymerase-3 subunit delta
VHFSRRAAVETALKAWSATRLQRVMAQLGEAVFETRKQPALATAIAQRTLISIANAARRKS